MTALITQVPGYPDRPVVVPPVSSSQAGLASFRRWAR